MKDWPHRYKNIDESTEITVQTIRKLERKILFLETKTNFLETKHLFSDTASNFLETKNLFSETKTNFWTQLVLIRFILI